MAPRGVPSPGSRLSRPLPSSSWPLPRTTMSWWKIRSPPPRGVQHRAAPGCPGRRSPGRLTGESPNGTRAAKNARPLPPVAWTKEPKPLGIACCGHRRLLRHASLSRHAGAWSQTTGRTMGLVPPATFTTSDRLRSRRSRQAPGVNCSRRSSNKKKNTGRKMRNAPQTISRKFLRRRRGLQTKNRIKSYEKVYSRARDSKVMRQTECRLFG